MKYTLTTQKTNREKLESEMLIVGWVLLAIVCLLGLGLIV